MAHQRGRSAGPRLTFGSRPAWTLRWPEADIRLSTSVRPIGSALLTFRRPRADPMELRVGTGDGYYICSGSNVQRCDQKDRICNERWPRGCAPAEPENFPAVACPRRGGRATRLRD